MELRSCVSWHFIQTPKDGLVVKCLNVNRGRPALKFKALTDIYGYKDDGNQCPEDEFGGFLSDSQRIKIERPVMTDSDDSESCYSEDDSDDLGSGKITLKQIREKCKAKKRKRLKLVDSRTNKTRIAVKEEIEEDDCDLTEPLILWKAKVLKKGKVKRPLKDCASTASPRSALSSIVKVETIPTDQDFVVSTESLLAIVKVKEEASEPDSSDNLNTIGESSLLFEDRVDSQESVEVAAVSDNGNKPCFISDSPDWVDSCKGPLTEESQMDFCGEVHEKVTENESSLIYDEPADSCGAATIASEFNLDNEELIATNEEPQLSDFSAKSEQAEVVNRAVSELAAEILLGTEEKSSSVVQKLPLCVLNEACRDYVEHAYSEPEHGVTTPCLKIEKVDITHSDIPLPESGGERDSLGSHGTDVSVAFPSNQKVQSPDESTHRHMGSDRGSAVEDLIPTKATSAIHENNEECSLAPNSCFIPSPEYSPSSSTETKQSQSCSKPLFEELTPSVGDDDCYSKPDSSPPQRLLSTRKAISPNSQEKLCKAMESIEIHEEEHYRPLKKLCCGQQEGNETEVNKPDRTGHITKIRFSMNRKQNSTKPKHDKRNGQTNATTNGSHSSQCVPRFTTGCNSIESCSQSAIAFSQRQMQDIECLASKLANELKAMKEIAEDRLSSESSLSSPVKYKPSEVRMAIKSATKAEQLANKWLSMMARDCNRFCKIMTLAEKDSDAPQTDSVVANKERKKITFADEAGEELCHVKFFEKNLSESFEAETEKSIQVLT